jgi:nucleotidyltransferase/DNA polymerase involved in DNA repair
MHGMVQLAEGDHEGACQSFQECISLFQKFGRRGDAGRSSAFLGVAQQELDQHAQARQSITTSINLALELHSFSDLLYVLPAAALLLDQVGQRPRALEIYTLVSGYPFVASSLWFADVIGRKIAASGSLLLPEMVTINQEREKARQLQDTAAELSAEWERNK